MGDADTLSPRHGGPAMPVASRGRPSLERAAEIGNLVVEAAITAFVEQGLDISIEQIAQSVGVSKQAVYRRWSSKIQLLMDVMDRVMARVHSNLTRDLPDDAFLALRELSRRMCEPDGGVRERSMTILMAEALEDTAVRHWLGSWRDKHFAFYRRYVTAVLSDEQSERSAETVARILLDIVEGSAERPTGRICPKRNARRCSCASGMRVCPCCMGDRMSKPPSLDRRR
ncbi:hypothetical protein GCM10020258_33130 [Sphingomonas yabuuchiae]